MITVGSSYQFSSVLDLQFAINPMTIHSFDLLDGTSIPWLSWGNGTAINGSEDAIEKGKFALQHGINHIDTAQQYKTERETGESMKRAGVPKDKVYVTSKRASNGLEGGSFICLIRLFSESFSGR